MAQSLRFADSTVLCRFTSAWRVEIYRIFSYIDMTIQRLRILFVCKYNFARVRVIRVYFDSFYNHLVRKLSNRSLLLDKPSSNRVSELPPGRVGITNDRVDTIIKTKWTRTAVSDTLTDISIDMVETTVPTQAADGQTQFGNERHLDPSDSIFVFKNTLSDYEEPPSDEEVGVARVARVDNCKSAEERGEITTRGRRERRNVETENERRKEMYNGENDQSLERTRMVVPHGCK